MSIVPKNLFFGGRMSKPPPKPSRNVSVKIGTPG